MSTKQWHIVKLLCGALAFATVVAMVGPNKGYQEWLALIGIVGYIIGSIKSFDAGK
jgi:hypothetical protein